MAPDSRQARIRRHCGKLVRNAGQMCPKCMQSERFETNPPQVVSKVRSLRGARVVLDSAPDVNSQRPSCACGAPKLMKIQRQVLGPSWQPGPVADPNRMLSPVPIGDRDLLAAESYLLPEATHSRSSPGLSPIGFFVGGRKSDVGIF